MVKKGAGDWNIAWGNSEIHHVKYDFLLSRNEVNNKVHRKFVKVTVLLIITHYDVFTNNRL